MEDFEEKNYSKLEKSYFYKNFRCFIIHYNYNLFLFVEKAYAKEVYALNVSLFMAHHYTGNASVKKKNTYDFKGKLPK